MLQTRALSELLKMCFYSESMSDSSSIISVGLFGKVFASVPLSHGNRYLLNGIVQIFQTVFVFKRAF